MSRKLLLHFVLLISFGLYSQTNDIILGKRFENLQFNQTTSRQIKHKFRGNKHITEKRTSYLTTIGKCMKIERLSLAYPNNGLTFEFIKGIKSKKHTLTKITLDSLSTDYINYSIKVNDSKIDKVIDRYGEPKKNIEGTMIYGNNSIVFYYDKQSVIRKIEINSNKIINEN